MKNALLSLGISVAVLFVGLMVIPVDFYQGVGASITTIQGSDTLKDSRSVINTNFSNLNAGLGSQAISTSSLSISQLAYITGTSPTALSSVATSSLTINSPLTESGTAGYVVGGSGWTLDVSTTTNSLFTGTAGQILAYLDGGWTGAATTTFSSGLTYSAGNVTADLGTSIDTSEITNGTILALDLSTTTTFADGELVAYVAATDNFTSLTCAEITGSADLCDGNDASGGGSSFGQSWEMFSAGYVAPTTTAGVAIGATTTASFDPLALFQVNATNTTHTLIQASTTPSFTGKILNFLNSAGSTLLEFSSGNLGIATSTPFAPLSVLTDTVGNALAIEENSGGEYFTVGVDADGDLNFINDDGTTTFAILDANDIQSSDDVLIGGQTDTGLFYTSSSAFSINADTFTYLNFDTVGQRELVVNSGNGDIDFNVITDDNTEIFSVDASTNQIGVGSTTPGTLFSIGGNGTGINFVDGSTSTSTFAGYIRAARINLTAFIEAVTGYIGTLTVSTAFNAPSGFGGRSLTISGSTIVADAELYTESASANIVATSSNQIATSTETILGKKFHQAATLTGVYCKTFGTGTSTVDVKINGSTSIFGTTPLTCGTDGDGSATAPEVASTTLNVTAVTSGSYLEISVPDAEPTGSRPRMIIVTPTWTWDD